MALQASGAITLTNIQTEFGGVDPISMSEYYAGADIVLVPAGTTDGDGNAIPADSDISMSHFHDTQLDGISTWPSVGPPGSGEISNWGTEIIIHPTNNVDAFCDVQFSRDDANDRIKVVVYSGTSAEQATTYTGYITYTGMSNATFYVKHNYSGSVTDQFNQASGDHYPDQSSSITKNIYRQMTSNGGGYQYHWIATRTSSVGNKTARVLNSDVYFTVKIVSGSVDYAVSSSTNDILLNALKGQLF